MPDPVCDQAKTTVEKVKARELFGGDEVWHDGQWQTVKAGGTKAGVTELFNTENERIFDGPADEFFLRRARGVSGDERQPEWRAEDGEPIARALHEAYERLAPTFGYETREESAVAWEDVPAKNKGLMRATIGSLLCDGVILPGRAAAGPSVARAPESRGLGMSYGEIDAEVAARASTPEDEPRGDASYENGRAAKIARVSLRDNPEMTEVGYARWAQGWLDEHYGKPRVVRASTGTEDALRLLLEGDEWHQDGPEYRLVNLREALRVAPDTGDWHAEIRALIDRLLATLPQPLKGMRPNKTAAEQLAALAAARPVEDAPKPTHICLGCGAVGYAGGYHDHGDGAAGDTVSIAEALRLIAAAGAVADERDELLAARPVTGTKEER